MLKQWLKSKLFKDEIERLNNWKKKQDEANNKHIVYLRERVPDDIENLINDRFEKRFKNYIYPFETSEEKLVGKNNLELYNYYQSAKIFFESKVFKNEFAEVTRFYYGQLSMKDIDETERSGYKLALIFLNSLEKRIKELADRFDDFDRAPNL